jgi:ubiquinone/menaquinone biosynthesis C-methylase UbiE
MNENHARVCGSAEWAQHLQSDILPVVTRDAALGEEMLEIGPGPGAATGWLRERVTRLTAVEVDEEAAALLAARYAGANVTVLTGSGTTLQFPDESFDSVATFTMLHHVPTAPQQFELLSEAFRVLRPGGFLLGSDSLGSVDLHHFHEGDVYNPVDPAALLTWLRLAGFGTVMVQVDWSLMFTARKPSAADEWTGAAADDS